MTKTKTTKRALFGSVIALALCFTMLLGTTYAWFTDSAASSGNIIQSGTLNIDLLVKGGDTGYTDYTSVKTSNVAVFDYDKWEPGYASVAFAKVTTTGNLAVKYSLTIAAESGTVSELADVIDVYYAAEEKTVSTRADITTQLTCIGTLADVISGAVTINDTLIPVSDTEDYATIALVMQTTAGNQYQNLAIGDSFTIKVIAGQAEYESDTFGTDYDAGSAYGN